MGLLWPLTGRGEELRFINDSVRHRDQPRGVVLDGAAGVGKTRLAREVLAGARKRGLLTHWAVATASSRWLPLGAFAGLVGPISGNPATLLHLATDALVRGTPAAGRVMIGVDDAHLLDDLSALLVHHLVLHRAAVVVVTVRSGELVPDAVSVLWKDEHLDRVMIEPLAESEAEALLRAVLRGPVDQTAARRMWAATRGNALFLRQLVEGEVEAGRLLAVDGVWRWSGDPALSPALKELVEARMGRLPRSVRRVVELLALGEPMGVSLLRGLTSRSAVEQAEARGLVLVERDGRRWQVRLAHPLYGEVRRAGIGALRARRLRGEIAAALAAAGSRRADDTLRRAVLAHESDLDLDPVLLMDAAGRAAQLCDLPLAERLARAAVPAGGGFQAQLLVASALTGLVRYQEAAVELAVLRSLSTTQDERIRATVHQVLNLGWMGAQPAEALNVLAAAEAQDADTAARLRLTALRAYLEATLAQPGSALVHAQTALSAPDLPGEAVALASTGLVLSLAVLGRADEIGPVAARGFAAAAQSAELAYIRLPLAGMQLLGLRWAGYLPQAAAIANECWTSFKGLPFGQEVSGVLIGDVELAQGRVVTAVRWLREARSALTAYGASGGWMYYCLIALTRALALTGDGAAARHMLAEARAQQHPAMAMLLTEITLAEAWVSAAEGAISNAVTLAHTAAGLAASHDQHAQELLGLHTAVRLGDHTPSRRLRELASHTDGPYAPAAAAHAAALAASDPEALHAASIMLEQIGDLLSAADAEAQAAAAYSRHGRRGPALITAGRSQRLAETSEGARTPALIAVALPLPLTGREREIATLASHGLSNREIAGRLTVSVRTIEGHLYRISAKLGTSNRTELKAILHGH